MKYQLKLKCPRCKNKQLYQTSSLLLNNKRKSCVYCGRSFKVKDNLSK